MAQEACAIVGQIRFEEQQTVWSPELEVAMAKDAGDKVYPGMTFSLAKERMESTRLWKIMRKMPKGALLHCHVESAFLHCVYGVGQELTSEQSHGRSKVAV